MTDRDINREQNCSERNRVAVRAGVRDVFSLRRLVQVVVTVTAAVWVSDPLCAGIGPENVVVVVNANSNASQQIADEYVRLRKIPACNVIRLTEVPDSESIDVDAFRVKLLRPVLQTIDERGLRQQIDCVAWSSDFPTAIDVRSDIGDARLPKVLTPTASLNGLTFLSQLVQNKDTRYLTLQINGYARRPLPPPRATQLNADDARRYVASMRTAVAKKNWTAATKTLRGLIESHPGNPGLHYNLACCLAQSEQLDAAITALSEATAAGWWNRRHAERDDDLKPLRGRDDFQSLLVKMDAQTVSVQASRAFHSGQQWNQQGELVETGGLRYLLSTVLAVTRGRGTSVDEAVACLKRSVSADGTRPQGTIYYMRNGNIRSTARDGLFPSAVASLKASGIRAEIIDGILPSEKDDVLGAMIGTASFNWKSSGSTIMAGAICDHFTSFGGIMRANAGQTPLTEFLRHGAAGASGTVTEPYAIPAKFPDPFLHVHYTSGCCLAEAYYQSVTGPYQLLIVGDPLCQPWAIFPDVSVTGINPDQILSGNITIVPESADVVARFELYVDGRFFSACDQGESLRLKSTSLPDGKHELRVVAVSATAVEPRNRTIIPINVSN